MADQLQSSNNKRRHEYDHQDEKSEQKNQKSNGNEDGTTDVTTQAELKTITNIYYDCLERIFDFLNVEDLLNVARTCKRLQIAAVAKYGDDHGKRSVFMSYLYPNGTPNISIYFDKINVEGLQCGYPFLRCFGAKISNLQTMCSMVRGAHNNNFDRYINEYCANTLNSIKFWGKRSFSIENFPNPFNNVTVVHIDRSNIGNDLPNFVNWFPNVRHLRMMGSKIDVNAIAVHFPHLDHLELGICGNDEKNVFTVENAVNFLSLNQQLRSLYLPSDASMTFTELLNMISANKSILKLENSNGNNVNVNGAELSRFISVNPLVEELNLWSYRFTADVAIIFINQLNSLKIINFLVEDRAECEHFLSQLDKKWQNHVQETHDNDFVISLKRTI